MEIMMRSIKPGDMFYAHYRWWEADEVRRHGRGRVSVRAKGSSRFINHNPWRKMKVQSMYPAGSGFGQYIRRTK